MLARLAHRVCCRTASGTPQARWASDVRTRTYSTAAKDQESAIQIAILNSFARWVRKQGCSIVYNTINLAISLSSPTPHPLPLSLSPSPSPSLSYLSYPYQFEAYGGKTDGVKMVETNNMGWGLVAARDVDEGEQLILLPKALQLTYDYKESAPGDACTGVAYV